MLAFHVAFVRPLIIWALQLLIFLTFLLILELTSGSYFRNSKYLREEEGSTYYVIKTVGLILTIAKYTHLCHKKAILDQYH